MVHVETRKQQNGGQAGAAWCTWGPKVKIDHLVWYAKLLLINMNYVDFFFFFKIL